MRKIVYCFLGILSILMSCKYSSYVDESNHKVTYLYIDENVNINIGYPKDNQFDEDSELFIMDLSVSRLHDLKKGEKFIVKYEKVDINLFDAETNKLIKPKRVAGAEQGDIVENRSGVTWYKYANIPEDRNLYLSVKLLLIINDKPYAFDKRIELRRKVVRDIRCD